MEIQHVRPNLPSGSPFVRWGVRGGALAALAPLILGVISTMSGATAVIALGFGAGAGAALSILGTLALRRRQISLNYVEGELERVRSMMERRLISEDEYLQLKSQILVHYQPGQLHMPNLWPAAYWGAALGMGLCATIVNATGGAFGGVMIATGAAGAVGWLVTGGTAQAYALVQGAGKRSSLPAPMERRLLDE